MRRKMSPELLDLLHDRELFGWWAWGRDTNNGFTRLQSGKLDDELMSSLKREKEGWGRINNILAKVYETRPKVPNQTVVDSHPMTGDADADVDDYEVSRIIGLDTEATLADQPLFDASDATQDVRPKDGEFKCIGAGSYGVVYASSDNARVYKVAKSLGKMNAADLNQDFDMHNRIFQAFEASNVERVSVPQVYGFVGPDDIAFHANNPGLTGHIAQIHDTNRPCVVVSQRVLPLRRALRQWLVDRYGPRPEANDTPNNAGSSNCLACLYLRNCKDARTTATDGRPKVSSLMNFPLYLDRLEETGCDCDILITAMGRALAVLHWKARVDADDIEFVLARSSNSSSDQETDRESQPASDWSSEFLDGSLGIWLIDFNKVGEIEMNKSGVIKAWNAWAHIRRYFPRPPNYMREDKRSDERRHVDSNNWHIFKVSYLRRSQEILRNEDLSIRLLPFIFMNKILWADYGYIEMQEKQAEMWKAQGDHVFRVTDGDIIREISILTSLMRPLDWAMPPDGEQSSEIPTY